MPWMVAVLAWDADKKNQIDHARCAESLRHIFSSQFSVYCPKIRELAAHCGRRVWREEFLFGRYAFVEKLGNWRDVFRHRAVREVLTDARKNPAVAPDEQIYRFKNMEDQDGYVVLPNARPRGLRRGDPCKITEGPFADMPAVYRGMGRRDRELALVEYFGQKIRVEVAAGALVPA